MCEHIPGMDAILTASHKERQTTVLVWTSNPIADRAWEVHGAETVMRFKRAMESCPKHAAGTNPSCTRMHDLPEHSASASHIVSSNHDLSPRARGVSQVNIDVSFVELPSQLA